MFVCIKKLLISALLLWALTTSVCSQTPTLKNIATKPNVLVILVDDLGYADIKVFNPNTFYDTPNIDKLAEQGIQFVNGYAANPVCSPSRYALLTGKHPTRANATDWFHPHNKASRSGNFRAAEFDQVLPHEELTIAEAFKNNGYKTAFLGKWHLGEAENFWPEHHGFDVNIGGMKSGQPPGGYFSPYKNARLTDGPEGEYLTERLTDEAISLVDSYVQTQSPFFMLLSFYTVHTPLQAPSEAVEKYTQKAASLANMPLFESEEQVWPTNEKRQVRVVQNHPTYAAMVNKMDTQVGRLLRKLDQAGVADNTIIVFTSDNGGLSTAEGSPTANLPLRGGKGWLYEGGIKVPFIIKMPHSKANSSVITQPVVSTDLYPTLLSAANLKLQAQQHIDGVDLTLFIDSDDKSGLVTRPLYFHYPHYSNQGGFPGAAIRQGDWKLIERFEDGRFHLYNLANDIGEKVDLSEAMPEKANELRIKLHQWYLETDARFLNPLEDQFPWSLQLRLKDQKYLSGETYTNNRDKLDVYLPLDAKNAPVLVHFHGGGLTSGSKERGSREYAKVFAKQGLCVVTPNYRLAPEHKFPAQINDASAAVAWAANNMGDYGCDTSKVFISGHSAGAYLAALMGADSHYMANYPDLSEKINGVIAISPLLDLQTHEKNHLEKVWGSDKQLHASASVTSYVDTKTKPMLIIYAQNDHSGMAKKIESFAEQMTINGNEISVIEAPNRDHKSIINHINRLDDVVSSSLIEFVTKKPFKVAKARCKLGKINSCTEQSQLEGDWQPLFNGQDLEGWTVKIHHHDIGINFGETFRVENGLLRVNYNQYDEFNNQYAHLFYNTPFTNFHLKMDYRFYGEFLKDAPSYAQRNSGVMFYSQSPQSILKNQNWPISVEMQFLAGLEDGKPRPTGNMCSPGTEIAVQDTVYDQHCLLSSSPTIDVNEWVSAELIVNDGKIQHIINGELVLEYANPTIGGGVINGYDTNIWKPGTPLKSGYIALQSEGHPIEFKNIEIKVLE